MHHAATWRFVLTTLALVAGCGDEPTSVEIAPTENPGALAISNEAELAARGGRGADPSQAQLERPQARDAGNCPGGTTRVGNPPPDGNEEYCVQEQAGGPPQRVGPYRRWGPSGRITLEGTYRDGARDGRWTEYYDDGQRKSETEYRNGKKDGAWATWFPDGQQSGQGRYRDDRKDGRTRFWHANGQVKADSNYVDDQRQGKSTNWYENGRVQSEGSYLEGKKDGPWVDYTPDGQSTQATYRAGARQ